VKLTAKLKGQILGYTTRILVEVTILVKPYLEDQLTGSLYI
jgi:hypothetical protein